MPFHSSYSGDDIHTPLRFTYADEAERTGASGFVSTDVTKFALQSDDNSVWMLTATTPTWVEISAHSFSAPSIYSSDGTIAANRTVTLGADLSFDPDTDGDHDVEFGTSALTDRINTFNAYTQDGAGLSAGSEDDRSFVQLFGDTLKGMQFGYFLNETSLMGMNINLANDNNFEVIDAINSKGMIYAADYSSNYTARSIVDKGYADTANIYGMDGSLNADRTITMGGNDIEFRTESANTHFYVWAANGDDSSYSQRSQISVDHNGILLEDAQATLGVENTLQSISISPSGIVFTDLLNVRGVTYAADYSAAYTNRSLTDKGYVDGRTFFDSDGDLEADTNIYLSGDDLVIHHGDSSGSPVALMTFHGDHTGTELSPRVNLQSGLNVANGVFVNYGKAAYMKFNDGTQSVDTYEVKAETTDGTSATNFSHMLTDFHGVRHIFNDIKDFEWYFEDDTDNSDWTIFDSSDNQIWQFTRNGHLIIDGYFELGPGNALRLDTDSTADDQWRIDGGSSDDDMRFVYHDDSAGTNTEVAGLTPAGTMSAVTFDLKPYQVSGTGTNITTTEAQLDLSTIDIANASYYTLATDAITVLEAGVYQIAFEIHIEDDGDTGDPRGHADVYFKKNGSTTGMSHAHGGTYLRENSGGGDASSTFILDLAANDVLTMFAIIDSTTAPDVSQGETHVSILKVGPT